MSNSLVSDWFGESFGELHPKLQLLHKTGGTLSGTVSVIVAHGIAGYFGRAIAKKFSIPTGNDQQMFSVTIAHQEDGLHWDRVFNVSEMKSVFVPVGNKRSGYWLEITGDVQLYLTVDVKEGGWYWRCFRVKYKGIILPLWLFPSVIAYKKIENEKYNFYVGFYFPILGEVLSYGGLLELRMP